MRKTVIAIAGLFVLMSSAAHAQTLKGSRTAMRKQNSVAREQDYTFLRTTSDVWRFVDNGLLVRLKGNSAVKLANVSFPYTRPAVKLFAERLGKQYKSACGEKLVVTSLTRPLSRQPWNASDLSVHPAGMAIDLRISDRRSCRNWLQETLVGLESKGVLEATRERYPAHFHVAVFPEKYQRYVSSSGQPAKLAAKSAPKTSEKKIKIATSSAPTYASVVPLPKTTAAKPSTHKVRSGETLSTIARKYGTTVVALKRANYLHTSRIRAGQNLAIPAARGSNAD
ncbi:MAG TPA: DUF5715 family protein [Longimicrobiales bacterium]|nr:DUF5715 family protein [Longimicrobiales bacterium]